VSDVTVIILTFNEEMHIARAVASVAPFASQVLVVDSMSTDRTAEIARSHGAKVLFHAFENQAKQFQWALENGGAATEWILRLDADEVIEPGLCAEILERLPSLPESVTGVNLKRKHIFMGAWIRYGGRYPLLMMRLFRRGKARIEDRWMDEHIAVTEGVTVTFDGCFADHNLNNLDYFIDKHNKYATREAVEVLNDRYGLFTREDVITLHGSSHQAFFKRLLKERVYNRLSYPLSSLFYFVWRYFVQLGFLDGRSGLVYHFLQGYWYRFLVGAKVEELDAAIAGLDDRDEIRAELGRLTGLRLDVDRAGAS